MRNMLLLFVMVLLGSGCEKTEQISLNGNGDTDLNGNGDTDPRMCIELVKFTDNKYRECILGEQIPGMIRLPQHLGKPVALDMLIGSQPFTIELPNGYWVKDWKWPVELLKRSTTAVLPYKWETLTSWSQTWDMPDTIWGYDQCIADYRYIKREDIDKYLSLNTDVKRDSFLYTTLYLLPLSFDRCDSVKELPEEGKELYYKCIHEQDSLHTIYVQRLIDVTNKGGFEQITHKCY